MTWFLDSRGKAKLRLVRCVVHVIFFFLSWLFQCEFSEEEASNWIEGLYTGWLCEKLTEEILGENEYRDFILEPFSLECGSCSS